MIYLKELSGCYTDYSSEWRGRWGHHSLANRAEKSFTSNICCPRQTVFGWIALCLGFTTSNYKSHLFPPKANIMWTSDARPVLSPPHPAEKNRLPPKYHNTLQISQETIYAHLSNNWISQFTRLFASASASASASMTDQTIIFDIFECPFFLKSI